VKFFFNFKRIPPIQILMIFNQEKCYVCIHETSQCLFHFKELYVLFIVYKFGFLYFIFLKFKRSHLHIKIMQHWYNWFFEQTIYIGKELQRWGNLKWLEICFLWGQTWLRVKINKLFCHF
jgi:hypothetical protein